MMPINLLVAVIAIVAIAVILLSVSIIFRKNGKFPEKEIGRNPKLKRLGLQCAKEEEMMIWRKGHSECSSLCSCCTDKKNCNKE